MKSIGLDARLASASAFVRQGAVFADIGTDHGYLPLFLLSEGRISRAICSDVNPGPLSSAYDNACRFGLSHRVEAVLADGLKGLEGKGITDIAICGMGGELIAAILRDASWVKNGDIRLILQPMSRQDKLRLWLWDNGFSIREESYSSSLGKNYVCMLVSYSGTITEPDAQGAVVGLIPRDPCQLISYRAYLEDKLCGAVKARDGRGGEELGLIVSAIETRLHAVKELIDKNSNGGAYDGKANI